MTGQRRNDPLKEDRRGIPTRSIAAKTEALPSRLVTPASEFVVAPAGYNFTAWTCPDSMARWISSGDVAGVRYSVMSGTKPSVPTRRAAARIRSR